MTSHLAALRDYFWPDESRTDFYAIVDGARDRRIFSNLINSYANSVCLYRGDLHPELEFAAPYLVQVDFDDRFTQSLIRDGWGQSWGVFLQCPGGIERLRKHLRSLLRVKDEAGRNLVFRYYDPRVLRAYLPTCLPDELRTVYGAIESFYTEGENPDELLVFQHDRGRLLTSTVPIAPRSRET
ncbi:MAG TPA: DUF4123 domain-containing protein [Paludibaculum sp.]|jgi:hypothetical protein